MRQFLAHARIILRHRDLVVFLACCLLLGLAYSFVAPFFSLFGTDAVGFSPLEFGVFMTITAVSAIVVSTVLARWSDTRCSRRTLLLVGSACGALGYVGYAFERDPIRLTLIGSLVVSISSISFSQLFARARELLTSSDIPAKDAPLYMNVFRLFFALAWTVGPALASLVKMRYSFEGTFLVAASLFVALFAMIWWGVPENHPRTAAAQSQETASLRQVLLRPDVLAHFVAFALVFAAGTLCMINLPQLVQHTLGGSDADIGRIYIVAPFFEVPFMYWIGLAATRGQVARLIRTGVVLAIVYYGLLGLVQASWHIFPLQILSAAITAVTQGIAITFFQDFMPNQVGTATNLFANAQRVGSTTGPLLFGLLMQAPGGSRTVFFACAGFCALALALLWLWRPREPIHA
jgi:MFS transporter, SET family, sugar efflux transporter